MAAGLVAAACFRSKPTPEADATAGPGRDQRADVCWARWGSRPPGPPAPAAVHLRAGREPRPAIDAARRRRVLVRQRRLRDRHAGEPGARRARPGRRQALRLLDAAGPGAVLRIWTATPTGTLRVYVDGAAEPALEAPMAELLSRRDAAVRGAARATSRPAGYNLYFPFPYRERCLVTVDSIAAPDPFSGQADGEALLPDRLPQLRRRRSAANVRPFSAAGARARAGARCARSRRVLRDGPPAPSASPATSSFGKTTVEPGHPSVTTIVAPPGGGAITQLQLTTGERAPAKLRSTDAVDPLRRRRDGPRPADRFLRHRPGLVAAHARCR